MSRLRNKIESGYIRRKKLMEKPKNELIKTLLDENIIQKRVIGNQKTTIGTKIAQIRHFRLRLYKIRNSIDYLLEHPFSMDSSYQAKHLRDMHGMKGGKIKNARRKL